MTKKADFRIYIIEAIIIVVLANAVVIGWLLYISSTQADVNLDNVQVLGKRNLCPGETLDYSFSLSTNKAVSIDIKSSYFLKSSQTHASLLYSEQMIIDNQAVLTLIRHWVIPELHNDQVLGDMPWSPGLYTWQVRVYILGSSRISDSFEIDFMIRSGCVK